MYLECLISKCQKEKDDLFVSDSGDDDGDKKKGSKAKRHQSVFHIELLVTHLLIGR